MEAEMKSLKANDVWELMNLPPGKKIVESKWIYKVKTGVDDSIERYKARLVAKGFTQVYRADYDETFCPVVRQESFRVLIALSVQYGLKLHQIDVTTAFLNGTLEEEVFMKQPKGFIAEGEGHLIILCKLKKSIYGLKPPDSGMKLSTLTSKKLALSNQQVIPAYVDLGGDLFYIGVYVA